MGKFSKLFIKSMQTQHLGLKEHVLKDQDEFRTQLELATCQIVTQLKERMA